MGGYAQLKTAIDRERASAEGAVFLADGGDTFQGSGPAAWSKGEVVLGPLNALGLDMFVPGNWEVVYGPEHFRELMARSRHRSSATTSTTEDQPAALRPFPDAQSRWRPHRLRRHYRRDGLKTSAA